MRKWLLVFVVGALLAGVVAVVPGASASAAPPRLLFVGQSTQAAWNDFTSIGSAPNGGSVYYELRLGTWVSPAHQSYATFLAQQGKNVQIGISWKDNPPGFNGGTEDQKAAQSRHRAQPTAADPAGLHRVPAGHRAADDGLRPADSPSSCSPRRPSSGTRACASTTRATSRPGPRSAVY